MSHSYGAVYFKGDGKVYWYEYDGTADVVLPILHDTAQGVSENWRGDIPKDKWEYCKCGKAEDVEIYSDYGGGFSWPGRACRFCMKIDGPRMPFDYEGDNKPYTNGVPEWAKPHFKSTVEYNEELKRRKS